MPFLNLNDKHFTPQEKTTILESLSALEVVLKPKLSVLTAEERSTYGSVNEQNKLIINKVRDLRSSQPDLSSPDVNWEAFENDHNSRDFIQGIMMRLDSIHLGLQSSKILHDWDNYQASLTDYDYTKYKESTGANGYQVKALEIKQFFKGGPSGSNKKSDTTAE